MVRWFEAERLPADDERGWKRYRNAAEGRRNSACPLRTSEGRYMKNCQTVSRSSSTAIAATTEAWLSQAVRHHRH